jgi:hypothetical protein
LRGNASRADSGKGEGGGADCDLSFQGRTPRCDLCCAPPRPPSRGAKRNPIDLAQTRANARRHPRQR